MARARLCAAAHDQHCTVDDDRSCEGPRRGKRGCPLPLAVLEPQHLGQSLPARLRLAADDEDRAVSDDGAVRPSRRDRPTGRPGVRLGVVEVDVAEVVRAAPSADHPELALVHDSGGTALRPRQRRRLAPAVRGRVVDGVEVERRDRVAAADDVDLAVDNGGGVAAAGLGERRRLGPAPGLDVVDMNCCRRVVGRRPEAADHIDAAVEVRGRRGVQTLARKGRHVVPTGALEPFDLEHRQTGDIGAAERPEAVPSETTA